MATAKFKISELPRSNSVADTDLLILNDSIGPETKSIEFRKLRSSILNGSGSGGPNETYRFDNTVKFNNNVIINAQKVEGDTTATSNLFLNNADIILRKMGPHRIRFQDGQQENEDPLEKTDRSIDLTWRSNPNSLGFEFSNNQGPPGPNNSNDYLANRIWETYIADPSDPSTLPGFVDFPVMATAGSTIFHKNLIVDSTGDKNSENIPNANLVLVQSDLQIEAGESGPNRIRFIDQDERNTPNGGILRNSIDLSYRVNPNFLCFEFANNDGFNATVINSNRIIDINGSTGGRKKGDVTVHTRFLLHLEDVPTNNSNEIENGTAGNGAQKPRIGELPKGRLAFYIERGEPAPAEDAARPITPPVDIEPSVAAIYKDPIDQPDGTTNITRFRMITEAQYDALVDMIARGV